MNYSPLVFCTKAVKQKRRRGFGPLPLICGVFFSSKPEIKDCVALTLVSIRPTVNNSTGY